MIDFIAFCRDKGNGQNTIVNKVIALRKYFEYRYITPNPCTHIQIQARPDPLPRPLLTEAEISELYHLYPISSEGLIRDKAVIGLLCYQGLSGYDIKQLKIDDIDRELGFIHVRKTRAVQARSLRIQAEQRRYLDQYIDEVRAIILADRSSELFCVRNGKTQKPEDLYNYIRRLMLRMKQHYERFVNIPQLRASVICNWLKRENLREVQYKAGHKHINSTERYQKANTEQLQKILDELHPLR